MSHVQTQQSLHLTPHTTVVLNYLRMNLPHLYHGHLFCAPIPHALNSNTQFLPRKRPSACSNLNTSLQTRPDAGILICNILLASLTICHAETANTDAEHYSAVSFIHAVKEINIPQTVGSNIKILIVENTSDAHGNILINDYTTD